VHTLDIASLLSESPLQNRSGMARVLKRRCKKRSRKKIKTLNVKKRDKNKKTFVNVE